MTTEIIETILNYAPALFSALSTILAIILMFKQGKLKSLISFTETKKIEDIEDTENKEKVSQRSYIDVMLELIKKTKSLTSFNIDERKMFVKSHVIIWAQTCGYKLDSESLDSDIETYYDIMVG